MSLKSYHFCGNFLFMEKIGNEVIINVLLTLLLYINAILVEGGMKLALNLSLISTSGILYNFSYILIFAGVLWIIPHMKFKAIFSFLLCLAYDILSFVILMKIQNDIFFVLLSNDIKSLIFQISLILGSFIVSSISLYFICRYFKGHRSKLRYTFAVCLLSVLAGIALNEKIYEYYRLDYETIKSSSHPGYIDKYRHSVDDYDVIDNLGLFRYIETGLENYQYSLKAHKIDSYDRKMANLFVDNHRFVANENVMSGIFEGKNLIMILCESLDDGIINEELMPNIYKIKKEGINFSNHYSPLYKYHTSDSEFISQSGMYPSQKFGSTYKNFSNNKFPYALGNLLKDKGYTNQAYHAFYGYFYNRDVMLEHLGFDMFYDAKNLGLDVPKNALSGIVGFYEDENLVADMFEHTDTSKPFYNLMLMLSGHSAYRSNREDIQAKLALVNEIEKYKSYPSEAKNYIAAQMLLDDSIGYLMEELERRGILEDTVICLYSDHYPYGLGSVEALNVIVSNDYEYSKHHTMWMIYNPSVEPVDYQKVTSTFDIYPTLANMFNLVISEAYVVGNDVFNEDSDNYCLFADGSILTDNYYYSFSDNAFYDLNGELITSQYDDVYHRSKEIMRSAEDVLRSDIYKK